WGGAPDAQSPTHADAQSGPDFGTSAPDAESAEDANDVPDAGMSAPDAEAAPDAQPTGIDLTGVWAIQIISAQIINAAIIGPQNSRFTTLARATVSQNGMTAIATIQVCKLALDPLGGVNTTYPQAALDSLSQQQLSIALSGTMIGSRFTTQPDVE